MSQLKLELTRRLDISVQSLILSQAEKKQKTPAANKSRGVIQLHVISRPKAEKSPGRDK